MRLVFISLLVTALTARADDDSARAHAHYEIGSGMYRLGDYHGAQREFAAGYELTHKPGFLLNLGQTYRKLHDLVSAREMYKKFLRDAPPDDPQRGPAQQVLTNIEAELREKMPATPTVPAPELTPPPSEIVPSPAPPVVAPAPAPEPAPAPIFVEKPRPKQHRATLVAGVTIGIVGLGIVGGGIGSAFAADGEARSLNQLDHNMGVFDSAKADRYQLDRSLEGALLGIGAAAVVTGVVLIAVGAR